MDDSRKLEAVQACVGGLAIAALLLLLPVPSTTSRGQSVTASVNGKNTSALLFVTQSQKLIDKGALSAARSELLRGLTAFPHEAALYNYLGVIDAEQNRPRAAERNFRRAIYEAPGYMGAYLNLGHIYQLESKKQPDALQQALGVYDKLLKLDPSNVEANYQSALILMQQGQYQNSINRLKRLSPADQQKPQALAILCVDFVESGNAREADSAAQRLLTAPGLTATDVLSVLPELKSNPAMAAKLLGALEARRLASPTTLHKLGVLDERQGRLAEAQAAFEAVAGAEPNAAGPLVDLAWIANDQHRYRSALGYLAHARALEPESATIHFFFGMVCVEMDLHQEAYAELSKAVKLDPDNAYYNYALGAVASERSDPSESIPYFEKYCALKPSDPRGTLALGAAYYYTHNLDAARKELLKVAENPITRAGANYFLGRIADDRGQWSEAAEYLKAAARDDPQYADAYAALGSVELNERQYSKAKRALDRALAIEPSNYLANLKLMVLYQRTKDPRASAQSRRFQTVAKQRSERARLFLRTIRVVP